MSQIEVGRFSAKRIAKVHLVPTKLSSCINGQGKHPDGFDSSCVMPCHGEIMR
jgi:hypothetical protein